MGWPAQQWTIRAYAGHRHPNGAMPGSLLIDMWHTSQHAHDMDVEIFKERMLRGEVSRIEVAVYHDPLKSYVLHDHEVPGWGRAMEELRRADKIDRRRTK